jgi:hypothetical protein
MAAIQKARTAINGTRQWLSVLHTLQAVEDYVTQQKALELECQVLLSHCLTQERQEQLLRDQHQARIYEEQQKLKEAGGIRVYAGEEVIQVV